MTSRVFINAATARTNTRNASVIHGEVRDIESVILANVDQGVLYANVSANTVMTDSTDYYNAYYSVVENATLMDQIVSVKTYFENLGYGVNITTNSSTNVNIIWNISW